MAAITPNSLSKGDDITIIDQTGRILVNRLTNISNPENLAHKLASRGQQLLAIIGPALKKARLAGIESLLIQDEGAKYCVLPADKDKFYITIVGNIE
ncbi:hypothetical protein JW964_25110 [candidate division KSB1 bacterium]|nr:hypothetical protein [candidate division KSB1 bacterium]